MAGWKPVPQPPPCRSSTRCVCSMPAIRRAGVAIFDGALIATGSGRYVNRGLGVTLEDRSSDDIESIESFFRERGLAAAVELSSWSPAATIAELSRPRLPAVVVPLDVRHRSGHGARTHGTGRPDRRGRRRGSRPSGWRPTRSASGWVTAFRDRSATNSHWPPGPCPTCTSSWRWSTGNRRGVDRCTLPMAWVGWVARRRCRLSAGAACRQRWSRTDCRWPSTSVATSPRRPPSHRARQLGTWCGWAFTSCRPRSWSSSPWIADPE